ncbi:unnamed protein product, partial [Phaeothamnion confervicola]
DVGGSDTFSVFDLLHGYFNVIMKPEDIPKTAMITPFGLFEYLRCPQGVCGAPSHFSRLMDRVLEGLSCARPYIDDALVHTKGVDKHIDALDAVLKRVKAHGLKLSPSKVHIGRKEVRFLGH